MNLKLRRNVSPTVLLILLAFSLLIPAVSASTTVVQSDSNSNDNITSSLETIMANGSSVTKVAANIDPKTDFPFRGRSFFAKGLFWTFYENGSYELYCTSRDGVSWTKPTLADSSNSISNAGLFDVWYDGQNKIFDVLLAPNGQSAILYKQGTLDDMGSISWGPETTIPLIQPALGLCINVDSNGYCWIGYQLLNVWMTYVIKNSVTDDTWVTANGFPYQLTDGNATVGYGYCPGVSLCPLTDGKMAVFCASNLGAIAWIQVWDGVTWSTAANTSSPLGGEACGQWNCAAITQQGTDNVLIVYLQNATNGLTFQKYNYETNSFSPEITFGPTVLAYTIPMLSIDPATGIIYCVWVGQGSPACAYYSLFEANVWSAPQIFVNNVDDYSLPYAAGLFSIAYSKQLCLLYLNCTNPPTQLTSTLMFSHMSTEKLLPTPVATIVQTENHESTVPIIQTVEVEIFIILAIIVLLALGLVILLKRKHKFNRS